MGLSQSLYTGYSGLHTHQKSMDNIGNNLANLNTTGYKSSDYLFSNLFKQAINTGGIPASGDRSATNPKGVGMGVTTGAIVGNFSQGAPEDTGNPLDCAINGNGFFVVSTRSGTALTRNGSFYVDSAVSSGQRMLCVGDGLAVQGWNAVNGTITPSAAVGNIYLPSIGDKLTGKVTGEVDIKGILPTNTSDSDFAGRASTSLQLNGNMAGDGSSMETSIFVPVTRTADGESVVKDEVQEVKVRIDFQGPTLSADGVTNDYTWTMTTVDWPNPGDPGVQVYPTADDSSFSQGTMSFYANGSTEKGYGAGQSVNDKVNPGAAGVSTVVTGEDGVQTTASFSIPADFSLDMSRVTNLADSPTGNGVETWHVDGNPKGTMARTITIYDEYTAFESVDGVMRATRVVEARSDTLYFAKTGSDNSGTEWSWSSSADGASGTLKFDTHGELANSTQTGGNIAYNFNDMQYIAHEGSIQATAQDGYRDGVLLDYSIDQNGKIWGSYSNDVVQALAQIAVGTVANTSGLSGASGTLFYTSPASGDLMIGIAGDQSGSLGLAPIGAGTIRSGALESSNVDLSREFTNMIQVERGYQFNSKIITTSNEMLQTALQMKN